MDYKFGNFGFEGIEIIFILLWIEYVLILLIKFIKLEKYVFKFGFEFYLIYILLKCDFM